MFFWSPCLSVWTLRSVVPPQGSLRLLGILEPGFFFCPPSTPGSKPNDFLDTYYQVSVQVSLTKIFWIPSFFPLLPVLVIVFIVVRFFSKQTSLSVPFDIFRN